MINLLSRFYDFQKGEILIDGRSIRDYTLESLRKSTGVVLQDVYLFNDTVLNNITLSNPDITLEMVEKAAREMGLYEYITALSGGFTYQVTERGQSLSAGQRQLIAFIRAYINDPKILVLDEATSSIDSESEALIKHATEVLTQNTTSIIVAHRLSTIQNANKILVIDKGNVVEEGTHHELLQKDGYYKKLYSYQFEEVV